MITRVNLASRPFTNRALPWAVTTVLVIVSVVALIFVVRATSEANGQAESLRADISGKNQQERQQERLLETQAEEVKNALTPEQLQTLKAAHELVDRKRFSWSRLFADLEAALPEGVRVTRISVRDVATRGDHTEADLDLSVAAKTPASVTDMISDMDRRGIFQAELRSQNLQKGRGEGGAEYELLVHYTPRSGSTSSSEEDSRVAAAGPSASATNGGSR